MDEIGKMELSVIKKDWHSKPNINNNEHTACQLNGCHEENNFKQNNGTNGSNDTKNENFNDKQRIDESNSVSDAITKSPESDRLSGNSTDNLSYMSDISLVEDLVLLPHMSDEEISLNLDDCVYAYRGGDCDAIENRNNSEPEDETDFLEMDFEPDPISETEISNNQSFCFKNFLEPEEIRLRLNDDITSEQGNCSRPDNSNNSFEEIKIPSDLVEHGISKKETLILQNEQALNEYYEKTGAKPKKTVERKNIKQKEVIKETSNIEGSLQSTSELCRTFDDICLYCLENEFLSTSNTFEKDHEICKKCQIRSEIEENTIATDIIAGELNCPSDCVLSKELAKSINRDNYLNSEIIMNSVLAYSFLSINVDEQTINDALENLGVKYDKEIIRKHFENEEKSTFNDIIDFILYKSKKDCNFKKITNILRLASNDELQITFNIDNSISESLQTIQVETSEILRLWLPKSDLTPLKNINRRFEQMNVLGKVINLIRQKKHRKVKGLVDFILIPQYYKTGYISVSKKNL